MIMVPGVSPGIIEEGDETSDVDSDMVATQRALVVPSLKAVLTRNRVADSRREPESDIRRVTSTPPSGGSMGRIVPLSHLVSPQGPHDDLIESWDQSHKIVLRKEVSLDSINSGFAGHVFDEIQFNESCPESPITPLQEERAYGDILWEMSGLGRDEMSALQRKLVERAKLEREALRGASNESPLFPVSLFNSLHPAITERVTGIAYHTSTCFHASCPSKTAKRARRIVGDVATSARANKDSVRDTRSCAKIRECST